MRVKPALSVSSLAAHRLRQLLLHDQAMIRRQQYLHMVAVAAGQCTHLDAMPAGHAAAVMGQIPPLIQLAHEGEGSLLCDAGRLSYAAVLCMAA